MVNRETITVAPGDETSLDILIEDLPDGGRLFDNLRRNRFYRQGTVAPIPPSASSGAMFRFT